MMSSIDAAEKKGNGGRRALRPPSGLAFKYRLRLALAPKLAGLGRLFGISWERLGEKLGREVLLRQVREVVGAAESPAPAGSSLDIVFLTMLGGHTYNVSMDVALGLALRERGHRVRFVVCDQRLPVCEVKKAGQESAWETACAKCWAFGSRYLGAAGFEVLPVSELARGAAPEPGDWREIIDAALLKHYRVGVLRENEEVEARRGLYAEAAGISAAVGRALVAMKPDRVIMSHGIYCTWGPARELLNEAGIQVVTYGKGKKRQTQKFNWTTSSDWWDVSGEWERVRDIPLTEAEQRQLDEYLGSRRDHSRDTLVYNFGAEESVAETRKRFGLDPNSTVYTLFTNVLWDAASAQREICFADPLEWVLETIHWFAQRPDRTLIVKIHPAETVIGTCQPFASLIAERMPELPANVRLIEPREKVNSWSIYQVTQVGLVHTSTVGMEMPLLGLPVVCVSRTHYRGRGFTVDPEDKDDYFRLLDQGAGIEFSPQTAKTLARRYAFLLFERYQLPWNVFHEPRHTDVRALCFASGEELLNDASVELVCRAIEENRKFLLPRRC